MNPRKTVAITITLTYLILAADKIFVKDQAPKPRILLALTVILIILGFGAEVAPSLAAAFTTLIFVSVLLGVGPEVFAAITRAMGGK